MRLLWTWGLPPLVGIIIGIPLMLISALTTHDWWFTLGLGLWGLGLACSVGYVLLSFMTPAYRHIRVVGFFGLWFSLITVALALGSR